MTSHQELLAELKSKIALATKKEQQLAKKAIEEDISAQKKVLKGLKDEIVEAKAKLELLQSAHNEAYKANTSVINALKADKTKLTTDVNELIVVKDNLITANKDGQRAVTELTKEVTKLTDEVSDLTTHRDALAKEIIDLDNQFEARQTYHKDLTDKFTAQEQEYTRKLSILNQKLEATAQSILDQKATFKVESENLAAWQKKLDARDINLRAREAKVDQSEKAIIRNSNLLNL